MTNTIDQALAALEPFSRKRLPARCDGNAAFYSISHAEILAARQAHEALQSLQEGWRADPKTIRKAFEKAERERLGHFGDIPSFELGETGQAYAVKWVRDRYAIFAMGYLAALPAAPGEPS